MTGHDLLDDLDARGLIHTMTDREGLAKLFDGGPVAFYAGYDPTASSLHLGSLVPTMILARLQRAGHKPIILVGGATGMVGDPSGKSDERNLLDAETLAANVASIRAQLEPFVDFGDAPNGALVVNNLDWFAPISFLDFLRDIGKHITVNTMMAKDSVRTRLSNRDQGISYTEFSYMLLQAYDFVHLAKTHECRLQVGGSDQWGNITAGIDLGRRMGTSQLYGFTAPLLLDSTGQKMGKTATGERIWLDPKRTSPYAFYQYCLNVADADVGHMLRRFSWRSLEEIAALEAEHTEAPHKRHGQRALAEDLTTWVHGSGALKRAIAASQVMFGGSLDELSDADLEPLCADVPSSELSRSQLEAGIPLLDLMVKVALAASKGAARRLVKGGGVYVNNVREGNADRSLTTADLATESMLVIRAGKKNYHIVRVG